MINYSILNGLWQTNTGVLININSTQLGFSYMNPTTNQIIFANFQMFNGQNPVFVTNFVQNFTVINPLNGWPMQQQRAIPVFYTIVNDNSILINGPLPTLGNAWSRVQQTSQPARPLPEQNQRKNTDNRPLEIPEDPEGLF